MKIFVALSIFAATPALAAVPIAGGVNFAVAVGVETSTVAAADSAGWHDVPEYSSLGIEASAYFAPASVRGFAGGDAIWEDSDAGSVTFDHGWTVKSDDPFTYDGYVSLGEDPDWSYTFAATSNGFFQLDYNIVSLADPFGLFGWYFTWNGGAQYIGSPLDPTATGTTGFALLNGRTYTVSLQNLASLTMVEGVVDLRAHMRSDFSWSILARGVPEPSTWGMMIVGFGLIGVFLRHHSLYSRLTSRFTPAQQDTCNSGATPAVEQPVRYQRRGRQHGDVLADIVRSPSKA